MFCRFNHVSIRVQLEQLEGSKVLTDDGLPVLICAQCIYQLNCSYKFKTQCENSDATLRKYLNNIELKTEIKTEFQDEASRCDSMINCNDFDEKDDDCVTAFSFSTSKQAFVTDSTNQQANVKLENVDNQPYAYDTAWDCSESAAVVSVGLNQYGTCNEGERRVGVSVTGDSMQIPSTKNAPIEEERNGNWGTAISVFKDIVTSYKEPQVKVKMKEYKRTLKNSFSSKNIYANKLCNMLVASEMNQHPKKQYTCQLCFQSYAGRSGLWQHLQKHSGRQYVCKVCKKHFTRGNILKQHERTHSENSSDIKCSMCKKTFLNIMQLKRHEIGHIIDWNNGNM
ncbi:zinc finger protein 778 isoform X2 [Cryptotermes secundus]|uniref:zinc finger protein 778 isoform X2 n=1 Tax=Cryptotermes secundus TaxID=105785 RepID=UPI000CD7C7D1|nr:zinc finger protein 778 isoform X2 [Cryptotermes secundus]